MSKIKVLLAHNYNHNADYTGYYISEKLDGWRAYWDGKNLISRNGNKINCPNSFIKGFPSDHLDGELWAGRGQLEKVTSIVSSKSVYGWDTGILYVVFDAPECKGVFEQRIAYAEKIGANIESIYVLPMEICEGPQQLQNKLHEVIAAGGEGLMLRQPKSFYERKRSHTLLKVKVWYFDEAVITGYEPGSRVGVIGSYQVRSSNGRKFNVSITEELRDNPLEIGTKISYKYRELFQNGSPKSPVFVKKI